MNELIENIDRIVERCSAGLNNADSEVIGILRDCKAALTPSNYTVNDYPDLSKCPNCGGPADNGNDRCIPPNPYYCTKCT